jgi:hypothetical protein
MTSSEGSKRLVHHLSAKIGSRKFNWVMPDGMESKQIAMRIGDPKPKKADKSNPKERAEERRKKRKAAKQKPNNS